MNTRLEAIRAAIRAENVSYAELAELQGMADQIDPGDTELLEWAGVEGFSGACADFAPDTMAPDEGDGVDWTRVCTSCFHHEIDHHQWDETTLNERVYDALRAAGKKALADEFANAMIGGSA